MKGAREPLENPERRRIRPGFPDSSANRISVWAT